MRNAIINLLAGFVVGLLVAIVFDIHLLRGYFLIPYIYPNTFTEFHGNFEYKVTENENGTWDLYLKNKDLAYYPIILYRENIFFDLNDSIALQYASRSKFVDNDSTIYDPGAGFDCGTGLLYAFIRPYETFRLHNVKIDDLFPSLGFQVNEMIAKGIDLKADSEISCRLYLPVLSFGEEAARVYSNEIKLKTDVLKEWNES